MKVLLEEEIAEDMEAFSAGAARASEGETDIDRRPPGAQATPSS